MKAVVNRNDYLISAAFGCCDRNKVRIRYCMKKEISHDSYPQWEQQNRGELQHQRGRTDPHPGKHNTGSVHPAPQSTARQQAGAVPSMGLPPALLPQTQRNAFSNYTTGAAQTGNRCSVTKTRIKPDI